MTYDSLSEKRSMTDPDMGTWTYAYDAAGNVVFLHDNTADTNHIEYAD